LFKLQITLDEDDIITLTFLHTYIWGAFASLLMGQPEPLGAGERCLIACTTPIAKLSRCISPCCLHPQKRTFLLSQAQLMQLFLSLMMY
jgi:hypothetical protein